MWILGCARVQSSKPLAPCPLFKCSFSPPPTPVILATRNGKAFMKKDCQLGNQVLSYSVRNLLSDQVPATVQHRGLPLLRDRAIGRSRRRIRPSICVMAYSLSTPSHSLVFGGNLDHSKRNSAFFISLRSCWALFANARIL